jgi:hypothetical protein
VSYLYENKDKGQAWGMKRTPEEISRSRQELAREIKNWRAAVAAAQGDMLPIAQSYLNRYIKKMSALRYKGRRQFWK